MRSRHHGHVSTLPEAVLWGGMLGFVFGTTTVTLARCRRLMLMAV